MAPKTDSWGSCAIPVETMFAHLLLLTIFILVLVWLLHFREGLSFNSHNKQKIFNLHPLFMIIGFVLLSGEAMMAYKSNSVERKKQKIVHGCLNCIALAAGIIGVAAVFKFHHELHLPDMYTLHSWFGISTLSLFALQFLFGLATFVFPRGNSTRRARFSPWHVLFGLAIFFMAIISAITGLNEKFIFLGLKHSTSREALIINFTGLLIFLFGASVIFTVFQRYTLK